MNRHLFICDCEDLEHHLVIQSDDINEKEIVLSIHLYQYRSFFQRCILGIKYIFGIDSKYGHYDAVILNEDSIRDLKTILEKKLIGEV